MQRSLLTTTPINTLSNSGDIAHSTKIYFDITDIVHFASRNNRLTGIQRVVFNIVSLLAQQHGQVIYCVYFDKTKRAFYAFNPSARPYDTEFDAESLLTDLGLIAPSRRLPSKVQIKSYLRAHARTKLHRVWLKLKIYHWAWIAPQKLQQAELVSVERRHSHGARLAPAKIKSLPANSHLVHLGSSWFFSESWQFAAEHRAHGGDVVQYVHDLIPITHPQFMPAKEPLLFVDWLNCAFDYASRFLCNSQWTAKDLRRFAIQQDRKLNISVVALAHEFIGFERGASPIMPERLSELSGSRFVLCVGTIEQRKNGLGLLKAWQQLLMELGEATPLLVFAGRYGRIGSTEFRDYLAADALLAEYIRIIDAPSDQALAWLYRNCVFSAYPSQVEGWGLPVGESAWFGRYCVASQASSVPEVCGDLMGYVDPNNLASIKASVLQALSSSVFLSEREAAIATAPLRTWQQVAEELYTHIVDAER